MLHRVADAAGGIAALAEKADVPAATLRRWKRGEYPQQRFSEKLERVHTWASQLDWYPPGGNPANSLLGVAARGDASDPDASAVGEKARKSGRRRQLVVAGVAVVVAAVLVIGAWRLFFTEDDAVAPPPGAVEIRVQNKVAVNADLLIDDQTQAYLSSRTVSRCSVKECEVEDSKLNSGDVIYVMCRTTGDHLTNANTSSPGIARNPHAHDSNHWYQAQTTSGRVGYIAEVYLEPTVRNLPLPPC